MKPGDKIIIYSGRQYGRVHQVMSVTGRTVQAVHVASGYVVTVHVGDCELVQGGGK